MIKDKNRLHGFVMKALATAAVLSLMSGTQRSEAVELGDLLKPVQTVKGKLERRQKKVKRMRKGAKEDWHYGGYLDVGYLPNLSSPDADEWRSKTTDLQLTRQEENLARGYVRKDVNPGGSRWGGEFAVQTGVDSEGLVSKTLAQVSFTKAVTIVDLLGK